MKTVAMVVAGALAAMAAAHAETPKEAQIKALVAPRMGVGVKVDSVTRTPYGLYEVRSHGDIFYTDESARYMFIGKVVDLTTLKDLTRERQDELAAIRFSDLPLDAAIKTVKGDGKRVMAVFEDPNCPYCRKLHETLAQVDNVTVYTFLLNILSEESAEKSKNIWCADNRSAAWQRWIVDGKPAPAAPAGCATPNDKVLTLGKSLHIMGTPTIYFADGSRSGAAYTAAALDAKLNAVR